MVEEKVDEILKKSIAEIDAMAKERGLDPSNYGNMKELATAIHEKPEPKGEKPEEKPEEPEGIDDLLKKTRAELDAIAEEKDLDPSDYHDKKEVAEAILKLEE